MPWDIQISKPMPWDIQITFQIKFIERIKKKGLKGKIDDIVTRVTLQSGRNEFLVGIQ
jgi:hypothetical protein